MPSTYLSKARHHVRQIEDYYDHAGDLGYDQAIYHWHQLLDLMGRAYESEKHKADAQWIRLRMESVKPKMEEMEKRKEEQRS